MNTAPEIIRAFQEGVISLSECWERLKDLRVPKPKGEPNLKAPPSKVYEPLNEIEIGAIAHLQGVSFGMARGARNFVHQVKEKKELTARQREYLALLVYKYRRQIFGVVDTDARAKTYLEYMKTSDSH